MIPCWLSENRKEWIVDGCHLCVVSFCVLPHRLSFVSVVFDFNASLSVVAPVFPILLSVDLMRMEKSGLLMDAICVLFLFVCYHPDRVQ